MKLKSAKSDKYANHFCIDGKSPIWIVNVSDRSWYRNSYVLWFGNCIPTNLMIWANNLGDALDIAGDWLAEFAPGRLANEQVEEAYAQALLDGLTEDEVTAGSLCDVTVLDGGNYILNWEWGITAENPTRKQLAEIAGQ
jgi:hypothetical protein